MNVRFELNKIDNNRYKLKFLDYSEKFINFISKSKIVHISFDKKIINTINDCEWSDCDISDSKFSYYISDSWKHSNVFKDIDNTKIYSEDDYCENKYIVIEFGKKEQIIKTHIKDFDKIFIKAFKVLSDTYNNKDGEKNN